jgi:hypothetical protein
MTKMPKHPSITRRKFLEVAQTLHHFTRRQAVIFFKGEDRRDKRVEFLLPHFERKGRLNAFWREGRKVYVVPRKGRLNVDHGLACTECLTRIWRARPIGEIYPEKEFKTYPMVPEWAIRYPNGKMLLFEFSTADNSNRTPLMKNKVSRYLENLHQIENDYQAEAIVLFVMDIPKITVERFVDEIIPADKLFFIDYRTFLTVHPNEVLTAPVYIWGGDGKRHPLSR